MKGLLRKTERGWMVRYFYTDKSYDVMYCGESFRLHPDDEYYSYAIEDSDWEGKEVEFEIVSRVLGASGISQIFAKLIPTKEQQKQLITEIMEEDAKDGLYEDKIKVTIKKDSEAEKVFNSLREEKQKFKEFVNKQPKKYYLCLIVDGIIVLGIHIGHQ